MPKVCCCCCSSYEEDAEVEDAELAAAANVADEVRSSAGGAAHDDMADVICTSCHLCSTSRSCISKHLSMCRGFELLHLQTPVQPSASTVCSVHISMCHPFRQITPTTSLAISYTWCHVLMHFRLSSRTMMMRSPTLMHMPGVVLVLVVRQALQLNQVQTSRCSHPRCVCKQALVATRCTQE